MLCSSIAVQQSFPEAFYPNIIWEAAEALEEFPIKTQKKPSQLKRFCHPTKHRFLESFHQDFSMAIEKCCWYAPASDRLRSFANVDSRLHCRTDLEISLPVYHHKGVEVKSQYLFHTFGKLSLQLHYPYSPWCWNE